MISSIRFRNSGRKVWRSSARTVSLACTEAASASTSAFLSSASKPSLAPAAVSALAPLLLVMTITVFLKSTVRPWRVGDPAIVQNLKHDVPDVLVGFFNFIEQPPRSRAYGAPSPSTDRLSSCPRRAGRNLGGQTARIRTYRSGSWRSRHRTWPLPETCTAPSCPRRWDPGTGSCRWDAWGPSDPTATADGPATAFTASS